MCVHDIYVRGMCRVIYSICVTMAVLHLLNQSFPACRSCMSDFVLCFCHKDIFELNLDKMLHMTETQLDLVTRQHVK